MHAGWCPSGTSNPVGLPMVGRSVRFRHTSAIYRFHKKNLLVLAVKLDYRLKDGQDRTWDSSFTYPHEVKRLAKVRLRNDLAFQGVSP